jgi:glc operon protein GlcG
MSIRLVEANRAIQAALAKAHNLAVNISVTVCDADGRLVAFQRMDGTLAEAHRAAYGKALASATSGRPSGDESLQGWEHSRTGTVVGEGVEPMRRSGGLPIIRAGQVEGAIGVAGATDEQCVECAFAGIESFTSAGAP